MNNKVSVIIPAYNAEKTIVRCMESVAKQSYQNIEVIIINDGSKDNTKNVIEKYISDNKLDWTFISRNNKGVSYTRNQGIKLASGEYVAFLDSDDYWYGEKLEKQIVFCLENQARIVGTCTSEKKPTEDGVAYHKYGLKDMLYSNRLFTSTILIEKKLLDEIGVFSESMSYSEDYNLWLRAAVNTDLFVLNEELVYYNADYNQGLSSKLWNMEKGELINIKTLYKEKALSFFEYIFFVCFSLMKYIRRVLVLKRMK